MSEATTQPLTTPVERLATCDPERARVALDAAWEIEALGTALIEIAAKVDFDPCDYLRLRGMGIRIRELGTVATCALGLDDDIAELRAQVLGYPDRSHRH